MKWKKSLRSDFGGKPGQWAYSESPLVFGNTVIVTPGGADSTVLALDAQTGEVRWKYASPDADDAGYASAVLVDSKGSKQVVQLLAKGLVGLDASNGKLLWRWSKPISK